MFDKKKLKIKQRNYTGLKKLYLKRSIIPAVTHVDYSARIQTVTKKDNNRIYKLLKKFEDENTFVNNYGLGDKKEIKKINILNLKSSMHTYLSNNKSYFEEILAGLKISFEAQTEKYSSVLQASEKVIFSANKIQGVVKEKFSHPPLSLKPLQKELTELKSSMVILSLPAELKTLENILTSTNETLEEKLVSEVEKQIFTLYSQLNEATNKIDLQLANIKKVKKSIQI